VVEIKKLLAISLILILLLGMTAMAAEVDVDMGLSQGFVKTNYRLDVAHFVFELPTTGTINQVSVGAKLETSFYELYGIGLLSFTRTSTYKMEPKGLELGVGVPINIDPLKIFGEFRVKSPKWQEANKWKFKPVIGLQFNFGSLLDTK